MSRWITHELFAHIPECHGYVPLSKAFAQLVAVKCDVDPFDQVELANNLAESGCAQEVMRWFVRLLQSAALRSAWRPIGGGQLKKVGTDDWHADDVLKRFLTSQYSRAAPFSPDASNDAWIFVDEADFEKLWDDHQREALEAFSKPRSVTDAVR